MNVCVNEFLPSWNLSWTITFIQTHPVAHRSVCKHVCTYTQGRVSTHPKTGMHRCEYPNMHTHTHIHTPIPEPTDFPHSWPDPPDSRSSEEQEPLWSAIIRMTWVPTLRQRHWILSIVNFTRWIFFPWAPLLKKQWTQKEKDLFFFFAIIHTEGNSTTGKVTCQSDKGVMAQTRGRQA